MTVTVKLDTQLEERLRRRAAGSGRSTSEVIRAALLAYLNQPDERAAARSAFERGSDLFGRHHGPADLAQHHKQAAAEAWAERHAKRGA